jgi:hypothetical protein
MSFQVVNWQASWRLHLARRHIDAAVRQSVVSRSEVQFWNSGAPAVFVAGWTNYLPHWDRPGESGTELASCAFPYPDSAWPGRTLPHGSPRSAVLAARLRGPMTSVDRGVTAFGPPSFSRRRSETIKNKSDRATTVRLHSASMWRKA